MRRLHPAFLVAATVLVVASSCSGSDAASTTTSTSPSTTVATDPELEALLLDADELPAGFTPSTTVDDTITAFCANEDATAGLQAVARSVRGFQRRGGGASVIQLAFRFRDAGASRFVAQAGEVLDRCSGVPDLTGLAFEYDALSPSLESVLAAAGESRVGRHGVSVGSGSLTINVAVIQRGDVGELVAVLGLDVAREELDALATSAFVAAVERL